MQKDNLVQYNHHFRFIAHQSFSALAQWYSLRAQWHSLTAQFSETWYTPFKFCNGRTYFTHHT